MPYILQERRPAIDEGIEVAQHWIDSPGDLNYAITRLCLEYLHHEPLSYERFNSVVGVLHCAAMELYREHIAPYEDRAKVRNGPVGPVA